jgi:hypothetical protein
MALHVGRAGALNTRSRPISALPMICEWRRQVRDDLPPDIHGHRANALADLSLSRGPGLPPPHRPYRRPRPQGHHARRYPEASRAHPGQQPARPRLRPDATGPCRARRLGRRAAPLILDEIPDRNDLRCLKPTVAYRKRALPIWSACYAPGGQPEPMPVLIRALFRRAAACLPAGSCVTLLTDRGLAWLQVVDACGQPGWHFVLQLPTPFQLPVRCWARRFVRCYAPGSLTEEEIQAAAQRLLSLAV